MDISLRRCWKNGITSFENGFRNSIFSGQNYVRLKTGWKTTTFYPPNSFADWDVTPEAFQPYIARRNILVHVFNNSLVGVALRCCHMTFIFKFKVQNLSYLSLIQVYTEII